MPGEGSSYAMNPAVAKRKAAGEKPPKAKGKGKGGSKRQFRSMHIESAKNGHTVRTSYKKSGAKNDWETNDENHVFNDVEDVKNHVGKVLGGGDVDADGDGD